jgi:hypothetical protein
MIKYIIAIKNNKLRHYKTDWQSHEDLAFSNGIYKPEQVLECGLLLEHKPLILECRSENHKQKHFYDKLAFDPSILRARAAESLYMYKSTREPLFKEGD